MKSTIYKICGAVPAGNYIQFPRTASQSLSLNGQFLYLLFKPIPGKFFFVHLDVVTEENLVIRISFSNLFKQFKMTTTWLQFPYISNAPTGSIEEATCAGLPVKGTSFLSLYVCRTLKRLSSKYFCVIYHFIYYLFAQMYLSYFFAYSYWPI